MFVGAVTAQHLDRFADLGAFGLEIAGHSGTQSWIGDPMRRVGRDGQVAARQLVFTLSAGFDAGEPFGDREVDGLVVADLEMQAGMVFDRTKEWCGSTESSGSAVQVTHSEQPARITASGAINN